MLTAEDSNTPQQFSARNSPYLYQMSLLQVEQDRNLPSYPYSMFACQTLLSGQPNYDSHGLNTIQQSGGGGLFKPQPPHYPGNPYTKDFKSDLSHGYGFINKSADVCYVPQKKFLIFDHSDDQTRLFLGPCFLQQDQIISSKTPIGADGLNEKVETQIDRQFLVNKENWDENHLTDDKGEMHEDTEEINALLYSDSDDDDHEYDEYDGDDDEVISPNNDPPLDKGLSKDNLAEDLIEEVGSSDGDSYKRQRLMLDGSYKKSSPLTVCEDDTDSSNVVFKNSYNGIDQFKREKKVQIREALKALSSIFPGLENKNPLSVLESSILYLESMKVEAEALGFNCCLESE